MGIAQLCVLDLLLNLCECKFPTWRTVCTEFLLTMYQLLELSLNLVVWEEGAANNILDLPAFLVTIILLHSPPK